MVIFQRVTWCLLWFFIVPFLSGFIPTMTICKEKKKLSTVYLCGWLQMIAIFQVICTVMVLFKRPLSQLIVIYSLIVYALAVGGLLIIIMSSIKTSMAEVFDLPDLSDFSDVKSVLKKMKTSDFVTWCAFGIILIFQILMSVFYATPNGDDSYYVTISEIANKLDGMYLLSPYTGYTEAFDYRHALSQFPMFYAFIANQTGLHSAIVAHTLVPPVLIIITYTIYYRIGCSLFENEKEKISVFMVILACLQMFGAYSIYTSEVFFLTRTWQGKSLLANVAVPAVLCILLGIAKISKRTDGENQLRPGFFGYFLILALANILGGFTSSLGLLLLSMYEAVILVIVAIRSKRAMVLVMGIASLLPSAIFMMLYILL